MGNSIDCWPCSWDVGGIGGCLWEMGLWGGGEKRFIMSEQKSKIGKPTRIIWVRSIETENEIGNCNQRLYWWFKLFWFVFYGGKN